MPRRDQFDNDKRDDYRDYSPPAKGRKAWLVIALVLGIGVYVFLAVGTCFAPQLVWGSAGP
jgi:hypothetical protein